MYIVKWRNRERSKVVVSGLRRYSTKEAAEQQVVIWQRIFPSNTYYIEQA